ncbi:MAG: sigma-54-dependent Fis family transcriptional regulator, partial [Acidobacteria bacterium]|nr:sigma-54-dependent Fis family transcriptional regulator [Acidobacteriota bacterium]
ANGRRLGKIERSNGGTLFLDEIGEISANAQVKLLRVLQDGEFTRVGGNETIKTDVRIIAATNQNLQESVEQGRFRKDLFYRLNVFPINLPRLKDRAEDIPLLVNHFIEVYKRKSNKYLIGMSERALRLLKHYHWPGNIRELENAIERAVIMAAKKIITVEDLPEEVRNSDEELKERAVYVEVGSTMEEVEKKMILETLNFTRGDKKKAATILGIGRKTLYRKLDKYQPRARKAESALGIA